MHVLVTGGTGFIGSALLPALRAKQHTVTVLSRREQRDTTCRYIRALDELTEADRFDAVINLAGASLAGKRWTKSYKREIVESRVGLTTSLIAAMQRVQEPPATLVSASAIGIYGPGGDDVKVEDSPAGAGFAAELCEQWEAAALEAESLGTRVCLARLGVVLDRDGGAMEQMARPFRFGVANWMGSGHQWLSWVHRADVVTALLRLLTDAGLRGPHNVTAPTPVTSRGFCKAMKEHYRTLLTAPVPAPALRLLLGEMAEELLLTGQRVVPLRLQEAGFDFSYPTIDAALDDIV